MQVAGERATRAVRGPCIETGLGCSITHLDLFLVRGGLLCLRLDALLEVVKTSRQNGDKATTRIRSVNVEKLDRKTYQLGSGFSRTAFCHNASLNAFCGRPYRCTCVGSTRL